ncbi:MAG: AbrB/MazE/SpoVT family DNA-binding domain-containing protein [Anaerolineales bacterium]
MANDIVQLASNGRITLPGSIRRKAGLSDGDLLRVEVTDDRRIILMPVIVVDRSQAYFWTSRWQQGEQEAEEDLRSGRVSTFDSVEDLIEDLTGED